MSEAVEVLVSEQSKGAVKKHLGSLPHVRFVSEPSGKHVARLLVAFLEDLEKRRPEFERWLDHAWVDPAVVPLVFLGPAGGKSISASLVVLQAMALVSKRASSKWIDPYVAPNREAARRLVLAHSRDAEKDLIASASLEDDTLYVWSCEPRLYRCSVEDIPALARLTKRQLRNFEVSSSGSRLHWPDGDVDINLDAVRARVDPEYRKEAADAYRQEASRYTAAIKAVREKYGLRQGDIEGLSERQVRRLEQGQTFPQANTVEKLAAAHGLSVADYLKELATHSKA
jgi:hypothetical protein